MTMELSEVSSSLYRGLNVISTLSYSYNNKGRKAPCFWL